jgi:hypothetical protein
MAAMTITGMMVVPAKVAIKFCDTYPQTNSGIDCVAWVSAFGSSPLSPASRSTPFPTCKAYPIQNVAVKATKTPINKIRIVLPVILPIPLFPGRAVTRKMATNTTGIVNNKIPLMKTCFINWAQILN